MSAAPFLVTFFPDTWAKFKEEKTLSKIDLVKQIGTEHASAKGLLRLLKLAKFGNLRTGKKKDCLRSDANMEWISGIEVDYDGEEIPFATAVQIAEDAGLDFIAYTTPSHRNDKPRWRMLFPLAERRRVSERDQLVARANGLFSGKLGPESWAKSQSFYFGYVSNGGGTHPSDFRVTCGDGDCIDECDSLDGTAVGQKHKKQTADSGEYEYVNFPELIRILTSGGDYHPLLPPLIGTIAARGLSRQSCTEVMRGLFETAALARPDIRPRWKEISEVVEYVYDKEESKQEQDSKPQELPPDIVLDDFYAFLPKHQYLYVPTQTLWPPATINSRLAKTSGMKAARHLDKFRAVSQMIWAPGYELIVRNKHLIEGGWIEKPGAIVFNQYRQPPVLDGDPDQAKPWLDLLKHLYPNAFEHEHLLDVLAFKLQHPEIKINHAIVLGGGMRIGKDTMLLPFKRALGYWNCVEARPTTIMGPHNGYMRSVLLMINEAHDLGDVKKHQFYDHMKEVIVSPPETVLVNDKYEKHVHVANVCLVVMTTNHRTDSIHLPPGDGRHFVIWSDVEKESYEPDFFRQHYRWLNAGGEAHVAAFLRARNVGEFDHGAPPPLTEAFHDIVEQSTPPESYWIGGIIDEMNRPAVLTIFNLITHADGDQAEWLRKNQKATPHRLNDCGYTRVGKPGSQDGRWLIGGKRENVYGRKDIATKDRIAAAAHWEAGHT